MSKEAPRTPKPVALPPGKQLSMFPLTPVDGFVLSRIDGSVSDLDLLSLTGLDGGQIQASLAKLEREGLIAFADGRPPMLPPAQASVSQAPSARPSAFANAVELQEDVDLEMDHRIRILEMHATLEEANHYTILGATRAADKKAIKRAYYEMAALFHPDRFFRKRLGTFKAKMEAIFVRATDAHDTLTDADRRAEYDAYIGEKDVSKALEADLVLDLPPPPVPSSPALPPPKAEVPPSPPPARPTVGVQLSEQARRDALARRLLGGVRPGSGTMRAVTGASSPPASDPDALKRHYENKMVAVRSHVVKEHTDKATDAMGKSDWAVAATHFRAALEAAPDDPALEAGLAEAQAKANDLLYSSYRKQASYEEKNGLFTEAAVSWQRAARARPEDANAHERAAFCAMKSGEGNLHEAAQLAQKAIALSPGNAPFHVTLSLVYAAAGLGLNARRELETAARLAPEDATIQALLARGSKG